MFIFVSFYVIVMLSTVVVLKHFTINWAKMHFRYEDLLLEMSCQPLGKNAMMLFIYRHENSRDIIRYMITATFLLCPFFQIAFSQHNSIMDLVQFFVTFFRWVFLFLTVLFTVYILWVCCRAAGCCSQDSAAPRYRSQRLLCTTGPQPELIELQQVAAASGRDT